MDIHACMVPLYVCTLCVHCVHPYTATRYNTDHGVCDIHSVAIVYSDSTIPLAKYWDRLNNEVYRCADGRLWYTLPHWQNH